MAACPTCHTSGANWRYCESCEKYFCANCERNKGIFKTSNKCPFCGTYNKIKNKSPK